MGSAGGSRKKTAAGQSRSALSGRTLTGVHAVGGSMLYTVLSCAAVLFLFLYEKLSTVDVVYSDYIRIINSYLPDTLNPQKLLVPDILPRIPLSYPVRWINVTFFHFSVDFDRCLGLAGIFLALLVLAAYCRRERMGTGVFLSLLLVTVSLGKFEILINGTGYFHIISFALFYWHFLVLERVFTGTAGKRDLGLLYFLPWGALLVAGPYLVGYCLTLTAAYGYMLIMGNRNIARRKLGLLLLSALLPLLLFLYSNSLSVYEYAGAEADVKLLPLLLSTPSFVLRFLLNGLASEVLGGEVIEQFLLGGGIRQYLIYGLGLWVAVWYVGMLFLYFRQGLWKRSIFPLLLLVFGAGNHILVFLSRYIFLNETYAWQSRYALQYQCGTLGILLMTGLLLRNRADRRDTGKETRSRKDRIPGLLRGFLLLAPLTFLLGNCYTTYRELKAVPYRRAAFAERRETALHYRDYSDQELQEKFEYFHDNRIKSALEILEENHLNIFAD